MIVRRTWVWLLLLPMFFQIFHYKPESGPLYPLSKAWPILLMPLAIYTISNLRMTDGGLYLVLIFYSLVVTPFLSMLYLPNDLLQAGLSTVKAWPLTFYFSGAAALILLQPSERMLARAAIVFGIATFVVMVSLWNVVPASWYQPSIHMFAWDDGRGDYIRMPMMLAELTLFWTVQRFVREWRPWQLALIVGAIASMVIIYKARLPTGVTVAIVLMTVLLRLPVRLRWGLSAFLVLPFAAVVVAFAPSIPELLARAFDESLFIRLRSAFLVWDWITEDPLKLLFGTGSISSASDVTLADFFGSAEFWLTDIGWIGVLMEFGVLGTIAIIAIHVRALQHARAARNGNPFRAALADYVLFEILCSVVYSVMYAVGPVVTAAAIAWWLCERDKAGLAYAEPGCPIASPAPGQVTWPTPLGPTAARQSTGAALLEIGTKPATPRG